MKVGSSAADRRARLSSAKQELLRRRLKRDLGAEKQVSVIPRRPDLSIAPLSFSQESLWILHSFDPKNPVHNRPFALRLQGFLDEALLGQVLSEILRRHEVLRAVYKVKGGVPVQTITDQSQLAPLFRELPGDTREEKEASLRKQLVEEAQLPFDLEEGPLVRARLFRLAQEEHVLFLVMHHIVFDGWSARMFKQEFQTLYLAFSKGNPSPLPELAIQYSDFAAWQRERFGKTSSQVTLAYWKKQLANPPLFLDLPTDHPRPMVPSHKGALNVFSLPAELRSSLEQLAREEESTLFMVLLAAFDVLLFRYTGQEDLLVGSPVLGRSHRETQDLLGFFVNTLVLRADLQGNPGFREFLGRVKESCLGAYANQDIPFENLVEELKPQRGPGKTPFFQVLFNFENFPAAESIPGPLKLSELDFDARIAPLELMMELEEEGGGALRCKLVYSSELFEEATVRGLAGHFIALLQAVVADPDCKIGLLPMLGSEERKTILEKWNDTTAPFSSDSCLHQLFEAQVARTPETVALEFGQEKFSYLQLNRRANQLANYLVKQGVTSEQIIGLAASRHPFTVVAMLGVLKAGGAYLPLDLDEPMERLEYMVSDAGVKIFIAREELVEKVPKGCDTVVSLDRDKEVIDKESVENPELAVGPEALIYVIYTSGTTGQPKGVLVEHKGMCSLVETTHKSFGFGPGVRVFNSFPFSFDAGSFMLFSSLCSGSSYCILPMKRFIPEPSLLDLLETEHIDLASFPPSFLAVLPPRPLPGLRTIMSGGEAMPQEAVRRWGQDRRLFNVYGPTEATVVASYARARDPERDPHIGRPVPNVSYYILDRNLQPLPVGVSGELFIGGMGVARGYLNRPQLTEERFIPDPFSPEPAARLYRTGDLCRYRQDGRVEFLGRVDEQLQLRGYRIEPAEIQSSLQEHPAVGKALVQLREDIPGNSQLVAYFIPEGEDEAPTPALLRGYLQDKLPDYMVPGKFMALSSFPLTTAGKIDTKALPLPGDDSSAAGSREYVEPRNKYETWVSQMFRELLGVERVGATDDFFELGGNSLLMTQFLVKAEEEFDHKIEVAVLLQATTVEKLAAILEEIGDPCLPEHLVCLRKEGTKPNFFLVSPSALDALMCSNIARYLDPEQPFYILQPSSSKQSFTETTGIKEMVRQYAREIREGQPEGPYILGGHCLFGTLLAWELALYLRACGEEVPVLLVLDAGGVSRELTVGWKRLAHKRPALYDRLLKTVYRHKYGLSSTGPKEKFASLLFRLGSRMGIKQFGYLQKQLCSERTLETIVSPPYPGSIVMIWAKEKGIDPLARARKGRKKWSEYAVQGLHWHELPGGHITMLREPLIRGTVKQLQASLEQKNLF